MRNPGGATVASIFHCDFIVTALFVRIGDYRVRGFYHWLSRLVQFAKALAFSLSQKGHAMKKIVKRVGSMRAKRPRQVKPTTVVVFGICRLGFIVALIAHLLLLIGALWMVVVEEHWEYLFFVVGYGAIAVLFIDKAVKYLRRSMKKRVHVHQDEPPQE